MSSAREKTKVCVLGIWHLGSIYSGCLAELGHTVIGWDTNADKIARLKKGIPPLFEQGLEDLLKNNIEAGNLTYTTNLSTAVKEAQYVIVAFDTPVDEQDRINLSPVLDIIPELANNIGSNSIIIITSQVPVGTCKQIELMIQERRPDLKFGIAYWPENLRLGQAIDNFNNPDRIIIGADNPTTVERVKELLKVINTPSVIAMDLKSAEMSKHALNTFLAMCISYSNEIGNLCDEVGADAFHVTAALQSEARIGSRLPLRPGLGFAGATLARDLRVLQNFGDKCDYETRLIDAILKVNECQNGVVVRKLEKKYGNLNGLNIGILGLTYKAGTSTLRRSAALEIITELTDKGAKIRAYDPKALLEEIREHSEFTFFSNAYDATNGCDAVVIITDWPEFKELDYGRIKTEMKKPVLVDARNILDKEALKRQGFVYLGIGRGE